VDAVWLVAVVARPPEDELPTSAGLAKRSMVEFRRGSAANGEGGSLTVKFPADIFMCTRDSGWMGGAGWLTGFVWYRDG